MPNTGRPSRGCHSCRQRRIKCDLVRPQCSQCLRKGRACPGYRNEEDSRFRTQTSHSFEKYMKSDRRKAHNQGIQLREPDHDEHSVSQQPIGSYLNRNHFSIENGLFPHRISPPVPFTSEMALSARWLSMAGPSIPGFATLRPLGRWTTSIPARIGASEALKLSVVYALDACAAHFGSTDTDASAMLFSGPKASQALRLAWATADPMKEDDIVNLIIAVQLNFSAEVFRRLDARVYFLHIKALSTLFKLCTPSLFQTELVQSLFSATIYEEVTYSYFAGIDSAFDDPSFLQLFQAGLVPWKSPLAKATAFVIKHLVQLPRALRLVRSLCQFHNPTEYLEAITLIGKLYRGACDPFMGRIIENICTIVPTRHPQIATLVPQSYHFESTYAYKLLIRYHTFQFLLYGLMEKMHHVYTLNIDMTVMRDQDVHAAHSFAMCMDHAFNMYPSMGLLTVRLIIPIQFSYYTWWRLENRSILTAHASSDYQRARAMKSLLIDISNIISPAWRTAPGSFETFAAIEESLFGGATSNRMKKNTDPALIISSVADSANIQDLAESQKF